MTRLSEFKQFIRGKRVGVIGIGISNTPVIDLLLEAGAAVSARDRKSEEALQPLASSLRQQGVRLICGESYLQNIDEEILLKAPGIRYDLPEFEEARRKGVLITSEMEIFFEVCPTKIYGITGSDGKTTTTTLIANMLRHQYETAEKEKKCHVYLGGNIGAPLLPKVSEMTENDLSVLELSSFQLQTLRRSPYVSVVTNVTPNHLNFHKDMEEYVQAKSAVFLYQHPENRLVLNYDNQITRAMAKHAKASVLYFSSTHNFTRVSLPEEAEAALHVLDGQIYYTDRGGDYPLFAAEDIKLPGKHNVENYLAACGAVYGTVSPDSMRHIARTFQGVEHRIEFVRERNGVKFYNSSIDSSPTRTIAALSSFSEKLIVILGGRDKHVPFEPLAEPLCRHAKAVVLTGEAAPQINVALKNSELFQKSCIPVHHVPEFCEAVQRASALAQPGDVVLLSPACTSFDAFKNFEERGCCFKEIVKQL